MTPKHCSLLAASTPTVKSCFAHRHLWLHCSWSCQAISSEHALFATKQAHGVTVLPSVQNFFDVPKVFDVRCFDVSESISSVNANSNYMNITQNDDFFFQKSFRRQTSFWRQKRFRLQRIKKLVLTSAKKNDARKFAWSQKWFWHQKNFDVKSLFDVINSFEVKSFLRRQKNFWRQNCFLTSEKKLTPGAF